MPSRIWSPSAVDIAGNPNISALHVDPVPIGGKWLVEGTGPDGRLATGRRPLVKIREERLAAVKGTPVAPDIERTGRKTSRRCILLNRQISALIVWANIVGRYPSAIFAVAQV